MPWRLIQRGLSIRNATIGIVLSACMAVMAGQASATPYRVAVLQGLNKVTARVSTIEAPVGSTIRFGTLEVIARHCDKRPPEETPESTAFMDIWEARPGESAVSLFRGWMFASSPALSALEHPVYDIWVLDCAGELATGDRPAKGLRDGRDGKIKLPDLKKLFKSNN
jgi:hypothetical protein